MTEREYILTRNLSLLEVASQALRAIYKGDEIAPDTLGDMIEQVGIWTEHIREAIEIEEEKP